MELLYAIERGSQLIKEKYTSVAFISMLDMVYVLALIVLILKHTYEASILTAYVTGLWCFLVLLLCIIGFWKTESTSLKVFYVLHIICSIALFIAAEAGVFSSY